MATKSFMKTVNLSGRRQCQEFIRAVERSQQSVAVRTRQPETEQTRARDLTQDQIRRIFCEKKTVEGEQ